MLCAHCGAPIRFVRAAGGWLHSRPLAEFIVSRREVQDIAADPPPKGFVLHRQTYIHPAQPEGRHGTVKT
jgi:hypothetical protein